MPDQQTHSWTVDDEQIDFPGQRKPNIVVCGATGSGKTTTINTLFGKRVGEVGHYSRGTAKDEVHEWVSNGRDIDVVDLPGLGDSKEHDREYREMYRRRVEKADAFIVVTTPPRPASLPTLRTIRLLLSCGVPANSLVIAFNRISLINVEDEDGELAPIVITGIGGPAEETERKAVERARQVLLRDLRSGTGNPTFTLDQIVAYDALTAWNLFGVLDRVVVTLPGDTVVPWRNAVAAAAEQAKERQRKRSEREERRIRELEAHLAEERRRNADVAKEVRRLQKAKEREINNKLESVTMDSKREKHEKRLADRAADWLDKRNLPGGKTLRRISKFFSD